MLIFFFCNHASKYTILERCSPKKSFLKKIISPSYEEKGRVVDVQYLDFIKVFNTFYPSILTDILVRYGMDKWMDDKSPEKLS